MEMRWLNYFRARAQEALSAGAIVDFDFSGSTYHLEVRDEEDGASYYPFLHFGKNGNLKDAFCSCDKSEKGGCLHLAVAYLKIFEGADKPWHVRYKSSFWLKLCTLYADYFGYEPTLVKLDEAGHYALQDRFTVQCKKGSFQKQFATLFFDRKVQTPQNSIKFSNLSQTQVQRWRDGRTMPALRFELSAWADLAKLLFWMQAEQNQSLLQIDEEKLTHFSVDFREALFDFNIKQHDLPALIERLNTLPASLRVHKGRAQEIQAIRFDAAAKSFVIEHMQQQVASQPGEQIGSWSYIPGEGFFSQGELGLLGQSIVEADQIEELLDQHAQVVQEHLLDCTITLEPHPIRYTLAFDKDFSLHINGFLFQPGDCGPDQCLDFGQWIYLKEGGFFKVEERKFDTFTATIAADQISSFVTGHRIWLNDKEGFATHLASIESKLTYQVSEKGNLSFALESLDGGSSDSRDFGDWIYLKGYGFYSKKHTRIGVHVRPSVRVSAEHVPRFIRENQEELENIKGFFSADNPLQERGIELLVHTSCSLKLLPFYQLEPAYEDSFHWFFEDYLYVKQLGFCKIPPDLSLPEAYSFERVIHQHELAAFFSMGLPRIRKLIKKMPPGLQDPLKCDLHVNYLARLGGGGLKAKFSYRTEWGSISVEEIREAMEKKHHFLFHEAGLLDLKSSRFDWVRHAKSSEQGDMVELSTLELLRLDAKEGLMLTGADDPTAQVTHQLLTNLRSFTVTQSYDLQGLKSELRGYQQTGLKWLWFLYLNGLSGLLCDEMGLGKTHQAMALICAIQNYSKDKAPLFLVVCPTSVIYHWQDKLSTFLPQLKVHLFHGPKRKLGDLSEGGVIVTSYGVVRSQKELFADLSIDLAVYDEVQVAKNARSRLHQVLRTLKATMAVGLTGTPIENSLLELKALFDLTLPGYMPKDALFRSQYLQPIERFGDQEKKVQLSRLVKPFILRRRKSEVLQELPEKSIDKTYCDLSEDQSELYQSAIADRKSGLIRALADPAEKVPYLHIFSLLSTLKQICNHPALFHKDAAHYKKYTSHKWDLFIELLEEAFASQQKVVIFSQYLQMLDIFELYLKEKGVGYAQIRGSTADRRGELERFQTDPECRVFIGSLQAAGLGIDLTAASVVIMYDRWWNLARENQAIDRVHRMGQKWGVQVYKLITKKTIEERIDAMITKKGRLMEEIVTADDQATLKSFTREELLSLLEMP